MPHVNIEKTYGNYCNYMRGAYRTPEVLEWLRSCEVEELMRRKLRIQRFFWHDYAIIDDDAGSIKAMKKEMGVRNSYAQYFKGVFQEKEWHWNWPTLICILAIVSLYSTSLGFLIKGAMSIVFTLNMVSLIFWGFIGYTVYSVAFKKIKFKEFNSFKRFKDMPRLLLLWDDLPFLSVYLEELIKSVPYGCELIGILEYIKYGTWANYFAHKKIQGDYFTRVDKHFEVNSQLLKLWKQKELHSFKGTYFEWIDNAPMPLLETQSILCCAIMRDCHSVSVPYPINTWEVAVTEMPCKRQGQLKSQKPYLPNDDIWYGKGAFAMAGYKGNFVVPGTTFSMFKTAIDGRVNIDVPPPKKECESQFKIMYKMIIPQINVDDFVNIDKEEEWRRGLNAKQKKDIEKDRRKYENNFPRSVNISMKADEYLYDNTHDQDVDSFDKKCVPRVLFNLSGWWLDKMGWGTECLTRALKEKFNCYGHGRIDMGKVGSSGYRFYVPYFTCGATSEELNIFYDLASKAPEDEFWFMVMGDDMASPKSECDFSKFDRTQDIRLIRALIKMVYAENPLLKEFCEVWEHQYACKKVALHKKTGLRVKVREHCGKMTGENPTCWSNSVFNILSTIYSHHHAKGPSVSQIQEAYQFWGFQAKYFRPKYVTFLKGVFLPNVVGGHSWTRLPSFLGKFGKTLTNWIHTTPCKTISRKAAFMLWSQWLGYGDMTNNSFYASFERVLRRLCNKVMDGEEKLPGAGLSLEFWQVKMSHQPDVKDYVFYDFLADRYNLKEADCNDFVDYYSKFTILPIVYTSTFVDVLVRRDYG